MFSCKVILTFNALRYAIIKHTFLNSTFYEPTANTLIGREVELMYGIKTVNVTATDMKFL